MRRRIKATLLALTLTVSSYNPPADAAMKRVSNPYPGGSPKLEQWIATTWPARLRAGALNVAWCESTGNPKARKGSYRGLFQIGKDEWEQHGGGDIYNPLDNAQAAYNLYEARGFQPWECRP